MPGIGDTLREARMRQRVDITELEASTKIRAKYLRALENEEFGLLPGPTYVKSFLRTYAEKLGLDPQILVEEYRARYEQPEPYEFQPLGGRTTERGRSRAPRRRPGRGTAVLATLVALLGFLLVLGLTSGSDEPAGDRTDQPDAERPERRPAQPREDEEAEPPPRPPQRVRVRVIPAEPTYACVERGGGRVMFEGTVDAPRTFQSRNQIRINLGKRSAALRVNGRAVEFEDGPDPLGFAFRRGGGRRELGEAQRPTCQ